MSIWEAIRGRRTIGRVKQDPIARDQIDLLLEAAAWAPSHHMTEPWRFFVMTGEGRAVLGQAYADITVEAAQTAQGVQALAPEEAEAIGNKVKAKAYRAPLVIGIAVSPSASPHVNRQEEFAAAHSAAQNMLLAAHAMGLGAIWRSGDPMYHERMNQAFGLSEAEQLVALIYIGYPDMPLPVGKRQDYAAKTVWLTE
ncbi:nitroreductase family protein [Paenibacillus agricola]|uniref:Putative NAD(P)H nitroreductase n=1 Tax=Paenibacillus agricola TaxID=2716264 RepID=A0ABX0J484_9BACL|nr:nitroreductase [Paenibacillus agricola]NHN30947.1 nitroreductase [Paenibacillus agricola]